MAAALLAVAAGNAGAAPREAADAIEGGEPRLVARLLVDPLGADTWRIGIELVPDRGWHVYWRNPGDTGLPPEISWQLEGEISGGVAWPTPEAFVEPEVDLISYGYERPVLLATTARAAPGATTVAARVDALVCAHLCLPGHFEVEAPLDPTPDPDVRRRFDEEAMEVPRAAAAGGVELSLAAPISMEGGTPRATLVVHPCGRAGAAGCTVASSVDAGPGIFPDASPELTWIAASPRPHATAKSAFVVDLEGLWLGTARAEHATFSGVVPLRDANGDSRSVHFADVPVVPDAAAFTAVAIPDPGSTAAPVSWLVAALYAWIGGLILNLMPCVLPVLAIKLASLASLARSDRSEHIRHATAYTVGITVSMLALALTVVGLRAAGSAVGWGFQLQEPVFLVAISALLVAFALNLFGAFEIVVDTGRLGSVGSDAAGARRSFFDGLLAVALATPCSAPFLGTAVGFAFASPAPVIISIFLAIGLGLATPFLVAAAFPGWTDRIPRSGAWMGDLRVGLGFALLLTVVWLLWILGRVAGAEAIVLALALLLVVAAAAWAMGVLQKRGRALPASIFAVVLAGIAALGLAALDFSPRGETQAREAVIPSARPFEAAAVRTSLDAGRPVFVYFTADWCITCKVNERSVLSNRSVEPELSRLGFDVYRADWTRRDDTIRGALAELGKAGVPVYALYTPDAPDAPRVLPELLTLDGFLDALREAAEASGAAS
jgi:thiol:disulfide interchange protein DsbD